MSIMVIFLAPKILDVIIEHNPTGPAPMIAMLSPFFISIILEPKYPLDKISPTKSAFSKLKLSGILFKE